MTSLNVKSDRDYGVKVYWDSFVTFFVKKNGTTLLLRNLFPKQRDYINYQIRMQQQMQSLFLFFAKKVILFNRSAKKQLLRQQARCRKQVRKLADC